MRLPLDLRYCAVTVAYLAAIYRLSAIPDLGAPGGDSPLALIQNLAHVPLFGGLAFCVVKSLSPVAMAWWARCALAFVACGACGALDEWHQSFVAGRVASVQDFLLDLAGIAAMLLALHLQARGERRRAVERDPSDPAVLPVPTSALRVNALRSHGGRQ